MRTSLLFCLVLMLVSLANAQRKRTYYLLPQVSLLNGSQHMSAQLGVSGGIQAKRYSVGIGTAVDYYKIRTVPVFGEMRMELGKRSSMFTFLEAGVNLPWALESEQTTHWIPGGGAMEKDKFKTGFFGEAGLGWKWSLPSRKDLLVSLGYSVKTVHQRYPEYVYPPQPPYTPIAVERRLDYTLNRLALRVGILFK